MSWFHQLLDGKSALPPKSSDSFTVLRAGGGGGGGFGSGGFGEVGGAGEPGFPEESAGDCGGCASGPAGAGLSLVASAAEGATGVDGCSSPQADVSVDITTISHTTAQPVPRLMIASRATPIPPGNPVNVARSVRCVPCRSQVSSVAGPKWSRIVCSRWQSSGAADRPSDAGRRGPAGRVERIDRRAQRGLPGRDRNALPRSSRSE
jgi:hypothetical protein